MEDMDTPWRKGYWGDRTEDETGGRDARRRLVRGPWAVNCRRKNDGRTDEGKEERRRQKTRRKSGKEVAKRAKERASNRHSKRRTDGSQEETTGKDTATSADGKEAVGGPRVQSEVGRVRTSGYLL